MATVTSLPGTRAAPGATSNDELQALFQAQKAAFRRNVYPSFEERTEALAALEAMVKRYRRRAEEALRADFRVHPAPLTAFTELLGPVERARFARRHLKRWMKPQPRPVNRLLYGFSRAWVLYQPVGVVGNISPWNFPIELSIGPLVDVLAAGNRAILKPSELAPASAALVQEMVSATFPPEQVAVVIGGVELAQAFARLPWDHLLYTGGPAVARAVVHAAAENLTPVTLELGGKSPAIVAADSVDERTVANILATKAVKSGQMCITVDYVFVPEAKLEEFVALARTRMTRMLPSYCANPNAAGMISERHLERVAGYVEDARARGARVIELSGSGVNRAERKLPFTLVIDPDDDSAVMGNEIFGPVLPVKPYRSLEDVIEYVNARGRPLALYVYSRDAALVQRVLQRTIAGGVSINTAAIHAAVPSLPFGGVGLSGMGRHHGFEGFLAFSHQKAVFRPGPGFVPSLLYPPYGRTLDRILDWLLK